MDQTPEPGWDAQRAANGLWGIIWKPSVLVVMGVGMGILLLPVLFASLELNIGLFRDDPSPWEINLCIADNAMRLGNYNTAEMHLGVAKAAADLYPFGDFRQSITQGMRALAHYHLGIDDYEALSENSIAILKYATDASDRYPLILALIQDLAGDLAAKQSRWDQAEAHYRAAFAYRRAVPPPNAIEVSLSADRIRSVLKAAGKPVDGDPDLATLGPGQATAPPLSGADPETCLVILLAARRTLDEARNDATDLINTVQE